MLYIQGSHCFNIIMTPTQLPSLKRSLSRVHIALAMPLGNAGMALEKCEVTVT
jgi:hypothetical protein